MAQGYTRLSPSEKERAEYMRRHPGARGPAVYFGACDVCGKRLWLSGLGIGSHERSDYHNRVLTGELSKENATMTNKPTPEEMARRMRLAREVAPLVFGDDEMQRERDDDRLARLETEFEAAGGRGVDLANEIDGLRRRMARRTLADAADAVRTIDLTPTWQGVLPGLLAVVRNGETVEARHAAEEELTRMAILADTLVEQSATHVPIRRFGGDEVAEREAAARVEARQTLGPDPDGPVGDWTDDTAEAEARAADEANHDRDAIV